MDNVKLQNDGAIYHWTMTETNTGPHRNRPSSAQSVVLKSVGAGGLIAKSSEHFDNAEYRRQLGL
jgi:hypothetical protein